jgi:hypothetical protein
MSEELKQFGLYRIIAGIVIFGLGIVIMMVLLVIYRDSSSTTTSLILAISIASMFILFYISLKIIGGRQESKLKGLVDRMRTEHKDMSSDEIANELKVDKTKVERYM